MKLSYTLQDFDKNRIMSKFGLDGRNNANLYMSNRAFIRMQKYVPFDTSDDYRVFIQTLIDLAQKKLAPEKPKYFSGKIVCITAATPQFTTGKIYDVVNGNFRDDKGFLYPCNHSIEEINSTNTSQFIELVE